MAYSSMEELQREFGDEELARLSGDPSGANIDTERISYAIQNGDAMIDTYLYGRYNVPLSEPIDPIITKISVDLAVFHLYEYAYRNGSVPASTAWRRINAVKMLKDIQKGDLILKQSVYAVLPPPIISNKESSDRTFSDELLKKFWDE